MSLQIATYNVNSIANPTKRKAVFDFLYTVYADIFLLQETHSKPDIEKEWQNQWTRGQAIFHSSNENTPKSGVAILVNTKQIYIEQTSSDLKGRILAIKLFYFDKQIQIINIYAPSGTLNRVENRNFFEKLYPHIISNIPVILAGDFNCIENHVLDKHPQLEPMKNQLL